MAQTDVNKTAPQAGNVNPQMGEAHKKMIAARLTQHEDLLTLCKWLKSITLMSSV
jgi:hypothetical protein